MAYGDGPVTTWPERIEGLAAEHPDVEVLVAMGTRPMTLTWGELVARATGIAHLLAERGARQGTTVCVELPNGAAHILATNAAWRVGATVLPLRPNLPAAERDRLIELADPVVVVRQDAVGRGELSDVDVLAVSGASRPPTEMPVASPAWMLASGGSTGSPKLIAPSITTGIGDPGTGRGASGVGGSMFADSSGHRHPTFLVCGPLYHMQSFATLHRVLREDYRIVTLEHFDTECVLDVIESERIALLALVPTMLTRLLRSPTIHDRDLSSIERIVHGGAACPDWVARAWIDLIGGEKFVIGYGMSEGIGSALIRGDEWLEHQGSVGKPAGCEALIVDEAGREVPAGELGEIYLRPLSGDAFRYVGDATIRKHPGGYLSVGDLGWVDAEGYLYIADRRTDMIVTGGANVFAAEVEAALLEHPAVEDAVVIGLADPDWGRRIHALVQMRGRVERLDPDVVLRAHCKERLAGYKVPRSYEVVDAIERTEAGKVNRRSLIELRDPVDAT